MIFSVILSLAINLNVTHVHENYPRSREYFYISLNDGVPIGLHEDRSSVHFKDLEIDARDCSTDTVSCFEAGGVFFAIPYDSEGRMSDGTKVETLKKFDMDIFGVRTHVHLIGASRNGAQCRYWYSYERGLIAFSVVLDGKVSTYVSAQSMGFKPLMKDGTALKHMKD